MHLVAEIIFIFLIVYLTGSSSNHMLREFCSIVFFYSSTFHSLVSKM